MSGYSIQAQKFAATHRIPLIEFDKMGFWADFRSVLHDISNNDSLSYEEQKARIIRFADNIELKDGSSYSQILDKLYFCIEK